jgi:hypothetical protein
MTDFVPIQIPPGVVTQPTKTMRSSNWAEVNMFRWIEGEMQPIGGQSKYAYSFASRCKAIHGWYDLLGIYHVAYVCEQHVYVDTAGVLTDITPTGGWPPPPLPAQGGYGDLNYSDDNYGTPRASGLILSINKIPNVWSVDNFGAILLVMNSVDGRLLQWDPAGAAGTKLTQVPATSGGHSGMSPLGRCFVVTPERFVMIFGMNLDGTTDGGSARRFGWCDQENLGAWNFSTVTSQAGFLDIEPASPIITAISGRFGTLFFTAKKVYVSRYLGLPYIYNYVELADDCTPWSPASITTTSSSILWQSEQGTFSFDGTTVTPVACLIRPWITDDVDLANVREQACATHVGIFSEFWWFYPQNGQPYNTRCAIYNYKEGWWGQAQMSRSAGITSSYTVQPIMADGVQPYQHEIGPVYADNTPAPWAESFDLNLSSGKRLVTLKQMLPDVKGDMPNVQFSFYTRMSRALPGADFGVWTPPLTVRPDGYVDIRTTGRALRMKISTVGPRVLPFTLGQHLMDFTVRGDR